MNKTHFINIIIIVLIGFAIYANSFQNQFIWDDQYLIAENTFIKSWGFLPKIFSTEIFSNCTGSNNFYRPIQSLTLLMDHSIWGLNPFGYHLTNILIHIFNALLIYYLVILLISDIKTAVFSALLFLAHPIQTEAVTYISGRADPLMAFFLLSSFILFIQFVSVSIGEKKLKYIASIFCFAFALLSKEASLIFPLLLLTYFAIYPRPSLPKRKMLPIMGSFFVVVAVYFWIRLYAVHTGSETNFIASIPLLGRLAISLKAFGQYIRLLILPYGLHMERAIRSGGFSHDLYPWISLLFLIVVIVSIFKLRQKSKLISFGLSWFVIGLLPYSNIYPLNAFIAEHWLYLPAIGFFMAISMLIAKIKHKVVTNVIVVVTLAIFSILTIKQNNYWKEPIKFFQRTLMFTPKSDRLHYGLGTVYKKKKIFDEAKKEFGKALELNPKYTEVYNDLGNIYLVEGTFDKAMEYYEKATILSPEFFEPYYNLGNASFQKGNYDSAIINYQKALVLEKNKPDIHYNLAIVYGKTGQTDKAVKELEAVLKLNPKDTQALELLKEFKK